MRGKWLFSNLVTNEQMEEALEAVASGETSINQAAKDYGVP